MRLNGYIGSITDKKGYLYREGQTDYAILIPECASDAERFAAEELTDIFARAGVKIETVTDRGLEADGSRKYIALGNTVYFKALGVKLLQKEFKFDGFIIESYGDTYIIKGVGDTGTCFGVYGFAEYTMGYVYYAEDEDRIETAARNKEFHIKDIPTFFGRNAFSYSTTYHSDHGFRLRINGEFCAREAKHGEGSPWSTLHDQSYAFQIMDYKKYGETHPDWYYCDKEYPAVKVHDGRPLSARPQICFSKGLYDELFFDTFVDNLINNYIIPEKDKMFFMLGISDNYIFCTCDKCREETEKYTRSGLSMRFVNKVADAVEQWRRENAPEREIYLISFAYHTIFEAPVIKKDGEYIPVDESVIGRDNVIIQYAPIKANYLYDLMDEEHNPESREALLGWKAVVKHLCVWDYRQDFHDVVFPFPTTLTAQANNDIYVNNGVMDVFNQAQRFCPGSPFIDMDNFARARLHWNGKENYDELTAEFRKAYYKDAEPFVTEYLHAVEHFYSLMEARGYDGDCHRGATHRPYFYTLEDIYGFKAILDQALAAAEKIADRETSKKVFDRVSVLTLYYKCLLLMCFPLDIPQREALEVLADVRQIVEKNDVKYYSMWNETAAYLEDCENVILGKITPDQRKFPLRGV